MANTLTAEQLAALQQVAKYYGRTWKQSLRDAWMTGQYGAYMDAGILQSIRNQFGPAWLMGFRLPVPAPMGAQRMVDLQNIVKHSLAARVNKAVDIRVLASARDACQIDATLDDLHAACIALGMARVSNWGYRMQVNA